MNFEKIINKVSKWKQELAQAYNVPESCVIWRGNNRFIVLKDGKEIYI